MREQQDIVVIGGGQAGLAMSRVLQQRDREHVVLERGRVGERGRIGERWRTERWDSLRFQFPNWTLQLPGFAYQGHDPEGFAPYRGILRLLEDTRSGLSLDIPAATTLR
jgi:putative flavoprotein involved in K+ transport